MKFPALSLALILGCTTCVQAQNTNLTTALNSIPDLTNFTVFLEPYLSQLNGLTNFTLLAPNNNAFSEFLNSSAGAAVSTQPALLQALLVSDCLSLFVCIQTHLFSVLSYTRRRLQLCHQYFFRTDPLTAWCICQCHRWSASRGPAGCDTFFRFITKCHRHQLDCLHWRRHLYHRQVPYSTSEHFLNFYRTQFDFFRWRHGSSQSDWCRRQHSRSHIFCTQQRSLPEGWRQSRQSHYRTVDVYHAIPHRTGPWLFHRSDPQS